MSSAQQDSSAEEEILCADCGEPCDPDTHECTDEPKEPSETTKRLQALARKRKATQSHSYSCPEAGCDFTTTSPSGLSIHAGRVHTDEAPANGKSDFACPEVGCDFVGSSPQAVGGHRRVHAGKEPEPEPAEPQGDVGPAGGFEEVCIRLPPPAVWILKTRASDLEQAVCLVLQDWMAESTMPEASP